jgi:DNA-binding GntR family transcriptional regulator
MPPKRQSKKPSRKAAVMKKPDVAKQTKTTVLGAGKTGDADKRIYEAIFLAVRSQQLRPGTKLTEASLCDLFNVSRTIVRKALQRLAHENIIELQPNRGATVASPTPKETSEVFAARRVIEGVILPLAIKHATKTQLSKLRQHIKREQHALEVGDRPTWIHLTGEFHLILGEIGGNSVLTRFLSELVSRCSLIIALYGARNSTLCDNHEHEKLVDLIATKDEAGALHMMEQHLLDIEQGLNLHDDSSVGNLAEILKVA